jgi:flavin reductase (DIM6/NTAB) family NADH-FMN oxidoreductase RutF
MLVNVEVPLAVYSDYSETTLRVLRGGGCLLVSGDLKQANVMTIGWGLIGTLWSRPFFVIAVRPSRHTYGFIERTGDFTVNVPEKGMEAVADYCGSVSGRDEDKFKQMNLTLAPGKHVTSPVILECGIRYECQVSYTTKLTPTAIPPDVLAKSYVNGDYHTLYYGEIVSLHIDTDLRSLFAR